MPGRTEIKTSFKRTGNEKAELAATLFVALTVVFFVGACYLTSSAPPATDVAQTKIERNEVEVDPTLTAEQAFAIDQKSNIQYGIWFDFRKDAPPPASTRLSESERERYRKLLSYAEMADVVLYKFKCRNILPENVERVNYITKVFKTLPEDIQKEMLAHEYTVIEAVKPYIVPGEYVGLGGWEWFCDVMERNSRNGIR